MKSAVMWAIGWSAYTPQPLPLSDPRGAWKLTSWEPNQSDTVSASQHVQKVGVVIFPEVPGPTPSWAVGAARALQTENGRRLLTGEEFMTQDDIAAIIAAYGSGT